MLGTVRLFTTEKIWRILTTFLDHPQNCSSQMEIGNLRKFTMQYYDNISIYYTVFDNDGILTNWNLIDIFIWFS